MQPIYCQSKNFHFLPFYLFNFLTFTFFQSLLLSFNQCLGVSYLILGAGLVKASCCQIILYILHFARFPILIFKINFAISIFGNFLRNVQLKWSLFKHRSHTTESVLMAIIFWQTKQPFWTFFLIVKFQTFCPWRSFAILSN